MNLEIKTAKQKDLPWINGTYKTIDFLPSTLQDEIVAIAYADGVKVGLGRIALCGKDSCELGGIYVHPDFRGKKIAKIIVEFLLKHAQNDVIYCIPFEHLSSFYESFGFTKAKNDLLVPMKIKKKLEFCKKTYSEPTLLLVMHKQNTFKIIL
ncbi:GNAT family N-acetyltransferase [Candidatus Woesearchaeota archaeon]|nr:GNAT family N-acetyltransferase [Candidatus Woesearchaeota archaeon]